MSNHQSLSPLRRVKEVAPANLGAIGPEIRGPGGTD